MDTINGSDAAETPTAEDQARKDAKWAARMAEADRTWQAQRDLEAEVLPLNKRVLFEVLAAAGISVVVVTFDGSGDSGQVEAIVASGPNEEPLEIPGGCIEYRVVDYGTSEPSVTMTAIRDVLENLAYAFLRNTHSGWENDDGAYGDFTFDVSQQAITLEYNERYTETHYHEHQF